MENITLDTLKDFATSDNLEKVVKLEKTLVNFLTQEQLVEIAKVEQKLLRELLDKGIAYDNLVNNLNSIGLTLNQPQNQIEEDIEEDIEEEDFEEDFEEEDNVNW